MFVICFMKLYLIRKLFHCVRKHKRIYSESTIVKNGCFVQEFLYIFLNFTDLWPLLPLVIQKFWSVSCSSQLLWFPLPHSHWWDSMMYRITGLEEKHFTLDSNEGISGSLIPKWRVQLMHGVYVGTFFETRDSLGQTVTHVIFSWNISVICKHVWNSSWSLPSLCL